MAFPAPAASASSALCVPARRRRIQAASAVASAPAAVAPRRRPRIPSAGRGLPTIPAPRGSAAPTGTPQYIRLTAVPRNRGPAASEVNAIQIRRPSPTPVIRRASSSWKAPCQRGRDGKQTEQHDRTRSAPACGHGGQQEFPTNAPGSSLRIPALKIQPICILSSAKA